MPARVYYGMSAWDKWERTEPKPRNLRAMKRPTSKLAVQDAHEVMTFGDLKKKVAFLHVMNKTANLLFRGQGGEYAPTATLLRDVWTEPLSKKEVQLSTDRARYWDQLPKISDRVSEILLRQGLPRHRPFEHYRSQPWLRVAPWSIIQHYELWPTPLLDLTSSLRAAASFALGPAPPNGWKQKSAPARTEAFLYVFAFDRVTSDVMEELNQDSDIAVVRLSAMCPPDAPRPHLQEGYLLGNPNFGPRDLENRVSQPLRHLIARFRLINRPTDQRPLGFWDQDFQPHTSESLLPTQDDLSSLLRGSIEVSVVSERAAVTFR